MIGEAFALTGGGQTECHPLLSPTYRRAAIFQLVIWGPLALYYLLVHPAWSWWYYLPPEHNSWLLKAAPLLIEFLTMTAGFVIVDACLAARRRPLAILATVLGGIFLIMVLVLPFHRWGVIGTWDEFRAGVAIPVWQSTRLLVELALTMAIFLPFFLWLLLRGVRLETKA